MGTPWWWDPIIGDPMDVGPPGWGPYRCETPILGTLWRWDPIIGDPRLGDSIIGTLWMGTPILGSLWM